MATVMHERDGSRPQPHSDQDEHEVARSLKASRAHMPSEVTAELGLFDRFAGAASRLASRAPFFAACVVLVAIWAPSFFLIGNIDTWQLIINTATTIITFLMVALLQNSQYRNDAAAQHKLNAIADGLADLMDYIGSDRERVSNDIRELRRAVGLEDRESSS